MQHFNSIKVRLEPEMVAKGEKVYIFQFHKGAIRTENEVQVTEESRNFNSIKVRLEPDVQQRAACINMISIP